MPRSTAGNQLQDATMGRVEVERANSSVKHHQVVKETNTSPLSESGSVAFEDVPATCRVSDELHVKSTCLGEEHNGCSLSEASHCSVSMDSRGHHEDHSCLDAGQLEEETVILPFEYLDDELKPVSKEHEAMDQRKLNCFVSKCQESVFKWLTRSCAEHLVADDEVVSVDDESQLTTVAILSDRLISIDSLEEIIVHAKSKEKMLVSAMESFLGMVRGVEIPEKAAEQAKKEALMDGLDVLAKVEDLKQMILLANKMNDKVAYL